MYLLKMNLKNYKHLIVAQSCYKDDGAQLYLIFQSIYTKLLQHFLVFYSQTQNGNLKDSQMKNLNLLIRQINFFLQNYSRIILD